MMISFSVFAAPASTQIPPTAIAQATNPIKSAMTKLKKSNQRWIEIDLTRQRLIAWQGKTPFSAVIVSTGKAATPTLTGVFQIQSKLQIARMQGDDYDISDVPFTMYYSGGYAIHGAYWHHSFGTPVSHGCVNVAVDHAERLFDWASVGTPIVVHN
ncbi:L,D-transpeptidase [Phormidesmis priestleyi ULC007]|uniref:L,D-transpeptidase n=2 Tax=Phormidesmis priestleyi TaxID=268141 RepID=A0A2T1DC36_9CYAN|nr:L,D-transpeptidase [Phormidesmis priestleyi ULC007]PZO49396.1 MAG: L,D-transpeptidase [Phormidesmis priestleyi]